jgi:transposase
MLAIPGAWVESVSFTHEGVVVGLRRRARLRVCPCGTKTRAGYDSSRRRWRHLDLGSTKLWLEAEIWRIACRACGRIRTEQLPWARPGARHSRDFEDVAAWLTQRTDKTTVARLLRCSWEAVDHIVKRVVAEHLDDTRLNGLYHLGVDEISYRRGHQYLTVVADHDSGRVVWVAKGRTREALGSFYEALGPERCRRVRAVSMDMTPIYRDITRETLPQAAICLDPFHAMRWVNQALDAVYQDTRSEGEVPVTALQWRRTRTALRTGAERLTEDQRRQLNRLRRLRYRLFRAWELKEQFRSLYHSVHPSEARPYLKAWCTAALRSRLRPFVNLVRQIRRHFEGIVAAVEWGLSNSRLEGIIAKIRLIHNRAHGHKTAESLTASIYLCLGGITVPLPTER